MPSTKALWKGFSGDGGFATAMATGEEGLSRFYSTFLHFITFKKLSVQQDVSHLMASEDKPFSCLDSAHW